MKQELKLSFAKFEQALKSSSRKHNLNTTTQPIDAQLPSERNVTFEMIREYLSSNNQNNSSMNKFKKIFFSIFYGALGDAIAFNNGLWEFCDSGIVIRDQLLEMGGIEKINITKFVS